MLKKIFSSLCFLFIFQNCSKLSKDEVIFLDNTQTHEQYSIGPFFLPENYFFSSISINYFTLTPFPTKVLFSMVGEIDWLRVENNPKVLHKMIFSELEESAVYKFAYLFQDEKKEGTIKTLPYGSEYEFSFCIASLESKIEENFSPNFIIVVSERENLEFFDFASFYEKNERQLSSTIFIPLFQVFYEGNKIFGNGKEEINHFSYKDVNIIAIYRKSKKYDNITHLVSLSEKRKTYIVAGNIGKEEIRYISQKFGILVEKIYVHKDSYVNADRVTPINKPIFIKVSKNNRYAFNLREEIIQ